MKTNCLFRIAIVIAMAITLKADAQVAGDYRTATNGDFSALSTWQTFNGFSWVNPAQIPRYDNSTKIEINHIISAGTLTGSNRIDQVVINAGAALSSGGQIEINDGGGDDLVIYGSCSVTSFACCGLIVIKSTGVVNLAPPGTQFSHMVIEEGGTCNFNISCSAIGGIQNYGTININGNLTSNSPFSEFLNYGTLNINSGSTTWNNPSNDLYHVFSGTINIASGASFSYTYDADFIFGGDSLVNNGTINTIDFVSDAPQYYSGDGTMSLVEMNGIGGLYLKSQLNVGTLTLTKGKIWLGDHDLNSLNCCIQYTPDENSYIVTNGAGSVVLNNIYVPGYYGYPVGTETAFAKFDLSLLAGSGTDHYKVRVIDGVYESYDANGNPTGPEIPDAVVKHTWIVRSQNGAPLNCQMLPQWFVESHSNNFSLSSACFARYNGGWSLGNSQTACCGPYYLVTGNETSLATAYAVVNQFITYNTLISPKCSNEGFQIPFNVFGKFNPGNTFTAQLSDAGGSFANPLVLGSLQTAQSGVIDISLPLAVATSNGYRIRIVSTDPVTFGSDYGNDISITKAEKYYVDTDGDGYGAGQKIFACVQPANTVSNNDDCDDADAFIHPGASELCNNNLDDDCNGLADDADPAVVGQGTYFSDQDGDGFGTGPAILACVQPANTSLNNDDCDDAKAAINPSAQEVCNGLDDNCSGDADEGLIFITYFTDADSDGYGDVNSAGVSMCSDPGAGYSTFTGDCNDADGLIHPESIEVCANNIDDNCNGQTDEGCTICYVPTDLTTIGVKSTEAVVLWSHLGIPEKFKIFYRTTGEDGWSVKLVSGNSTKTKLTDLAPSSPYKWFVIAICGQLNEKSEFAEFVTDDGEGSELNKEMQPNASVIPGAKVTLYPNPANGHFFIDAKGLSSETKIANIQIISLTGAIVYSDEQEVLNGSLNQEITLKGSISSGNYFVRVITAHEVITATLIYQK